MQYFITNEFQSTGYRQLYKGTQTISFNKGVRCSVEERLQIHEALAIPGISNLKKKNETQKVKYQTQ